MITQNLLDEKLISELLNKEYSDTGLIILDETDSTNTYAKSIVANKKTPFAVIASKQNKGRGRYSKSFFSPQGKGLYLSAVIKPKTALEEVSNLTVITAVLVSEALEELCKIEPKIKWINDIFTDGKKLCGILTEAGISAQTKTADFVVIGIGINLKGKTQEWPDDLKAIATSLENEGVDININVLAADILNRLYALEKSDLKEIMKKKIGGYKNRLFILNKKISVIAPDGKREAVALDIDENARLKVRYENGETEYLNSGEISIKQFE